MVDEQEVPNMFKTDGETSTYFDNNIHQGEQSLSREEVTAQEDEPIMIMDNSDSRTTTNRYKRVNKS